jgi:hypothetical protein
VLGVVRLVGRHQRSDFIQCLRWEGAFGQLSNAFSDEGTVGLERMGGKASSGQGAIHRRGDVSQAVDQGPVEVENDAAHLSAGS